VNADQKAAVEAWLAKRSLHNLEVLARELDISEAVAFVDEYCALYTNNFDPDTELIEESK
jgi:hypothetical protein